MISLSKITTEGKALFLAYDQGLEHGPTDFNEKNVDPEYIMDIAIRGKCNAVVFQKGVAEKYYNGKVPLILKLNGKTNFLKGDPISPQVCSVKEAIELGAKAVGYTIYAGSSHEPSIFKEFQKIQEEAHENGLPVIAWMYPRGEAIKDDKTKEVLAYAARIGLELGADIVKLKYSGSVDSFRWVVKSAGKTKVVVAGGSKLTEDKLLTEVHEIMQAGGSGMAIGRNIWQHDNPIKMTSALRKVIFDGKSPAEALKEFK